MKNTCVSLAGLGVIALLCFLCIRTRTPAMVGDLFRRGSAALAENGIPAEGISFSGRDAKLTGAAGTPIVSDKAVEVMCDVYGVRTVEVRYLPVDSVPAEASSPEPPPTSVLPTAEPESRAQNAAALNAAPVGFAGSSVELPPDSRSALDRLVGVLTAHSGVKVAIEGHTDSAGVPAMNLEPSRVRAESVRVYLLAHGIGGARLTATASAPPAPSTETTLRKAGSGIAELSSR